MSRFGSRASIAPVALSCSLLWLACSDDEPSGNGTHTPGPKVTALRGEVRRAGGGPLAGVKISAGTVSATTDASGRYELRAGAGARRVRFELGGYVDGFRTPVLLDGSPTQLDLALLPLAEPQQLDVAAGGKTEGERGAALLAPPEAFVDADGQPVTGMVDVYLTPLDPSVDDERAAAPEFVTERSGSPALLESFGIMDVQVRKGDARLSVAEGKALELSIPAPAGAEPPATMDLWSFDEDRSVWVHEGEATYDATSRTYTGRSEHMSLWNIDQVYTATCVCGVVRDKEGGALPGARVDAHGVSYFGTSSTHSDDDGRFCVAVRKDSDVDIAAYHASGGGQSRRVHSGTADTEVPPPVGASDCHDAGTWEVRRDEFTGSDGETQRCGDLDNPFSDGCAGDLFEVFGTCFRPQGECTISLSGTQTVIRYANGAYSEGGIAGSSYYSSAGMLCASATFQLESTDDIRIVYTLPGRGMYTMTVGAEGNGDYEIECPSGERTRITPAQQQALEACSSPAQTSDEAQECTIEGQPGLDGGVGVPGTCTEDADCTGGTICCEIPDASVNFCFTQEVCDLVKQQM